MGNMLKNLLGLIGLTPNSAWAGVWAAMVAGLISYIVATINAQSARKLSRDNARREHRLKILSPISTYVETRVGMYVHMVRLLKTKRIEEANALYESMETMKINLETSSAVFYIQKSYRVGLILAYFLDTAAEALVSAPHYLRKNLGQDGCPSEK